MIDQLRARKAAFVAVVFLSGVLVGTVLTAGIAAGKLAAMVRQTAAAPAQPDRLRRAVDLISRLASRNFRASPSQRAALEASVDRHWPGILQAREASRRAFLGQVKDIYLEIKPLLSEDQIRQAESRLHFKE